jgi:hypothetical protein
LCPRSRSRRVLVGMPRAGRSRRVSWRRYGRWRWRLVSRRRGSVRRPRGVRSVRRTVRRSWRSVKVGTAKGAAVAVGTREVRVVARAVRTAVAGSSWTRTATACATAPVRRVVVAAATARAGAAAAAATGRAGVAAAAGTRARRGSFGSRSRVSGRNDVLGNLPSGRPSCRASASRASTRCGFVLIPDGSPIVSC